MIQVLNGRQHLPRVAACRGELPHELGQRCTGAIQRGHCRKRFARRLRSIIPQEHDIGCGVVVVGLGSKEAWGDVGGRDGSLLGRVSR